MWWLVCQIKFSSLTLLQQYWIDYRMERVVSWKPYCLHYVSVELCNQFKYNKQRVTCYDFCANLSLVAYVGWKPHKTIYSLQRDFVIRVALGKLGHFKTDRSCSSCFIHLASILVQTFSVHLSFSFSHCLSKLVTYSGV